MSICKDYPDFQDLLEKGYRITVEYTSGGTKTTKQKKVSVSISYEEMVFSNKEVSCVMYYPANKTFIARAEKHGKKKIIVLENVIAILAEEG